MNKIRQVIRQSKTLIGPFPEFNIHEVPALPHDLFLQWCQTAIEHDVLDPHSMTLSTVDQNGYPDARVLILKDVDEGGWYFASSSKSEKGKQIEINPNVALTFYWSQVGRQIRIRGKAIEMEKDKSAKEFLKRGMIARALTLIEKQSTELRERGEVEKALEIEIKRLQHNPDLISSSWVLYRVAAREVEFWQADEERNHIRLKYTLDQNKWKRNLLWP
ncbi:pyridoxine/pyridoxamine 5'-phosphate oxidase [Bacillus sp. B-jedd]|uniref:pyridoxine/pyridoxamine 5'-phosphate oxidase n=1 Tax=Bacillus sp. B-jedd TaxID=1476857 RepID=UPI0005155CCC|nr:pyridoxal 5'-phosphate synthase [Bacillus sp. B-jedd]CEG26244.1 Pyridoxine/pyridoxamine 5'-phosphate oxidase [Bacillus sp. B-jedd]